MMILLPSIPFSSCLVSFSSKWWGCLSHMNYNTLLDVQSSLPFYIITLFFLYYSLIRLLYSLSCCILSFNPSIGSICCSVDDVRCSDHDVLWCCCTYDHQKERNSCLTMMIFRTTHDSFCFRFSPDDRDTKRRRVEREKKDERMGRRVRKRMGEEETEE